MHESSGTIHASRMQARWREVPAAQALWLSPVATLQPATPSAAKRHGARRADDGPCGDLAGETEQDQTAGKASAAPVRRPNE